MNAPWLASVHPVTYACILAVLCGSCARSKDNSRQPAPNEDGDAVPPQMGVDRQTLDEAVIEAALVDLLAGADEDSETLRREQGRGKLLFSGKSRVWVGTLNQALASAESEKWKALGSSDRRAAKGAAAMLTDRVQAKQYFTAFRPRDSRISLWEDNPASTQPAEPRRFAGPRPILAAPPGYDDLNRLAVVVFSFAWSMHGGDAVYVLRFDGKRWSVISRHFLYYV